MNPSQTLVSLFHSSSIKKSLSNEGQAVKHSFIRYRLEGKAESKAHLTWCLETIG
jgi:hypothetical protein